MEEDFEFESYDIVHESTEMSFGWCFIIYFVALEDEPSLAAFRLSLTIFWSWMWSGTMNIFLRIVSVHGSDVIGWDVMSKGGMEIWRPMGTPFV